MSHQSYWLTKPKFKDSKLNSTYSGLEISFIIAILFYIIVNVIFLIISKIISQYWMLYIRATLDRSIKYAAYSANLFELFCNLLVFSVIFSALRISRFLSSVYYFALSMYYTFIRYMYVVLMYLHICLKTCIWFTRKCTKLLSYIS